MNKKIRVVIIGIVILIISGCLQSPKEKEPMTVTPGITAVTVVPTTPKVTEAPTPEQTPLPTPQITPEPAPKELSGTLYVLAEMKTPIYVANKKYSLESLRVEVSNQVDAPISVKAQIVSGEQILEEHMFTLERQGSRNVFTNEKQHLIEKSNDVTLRLFVQGYKPAEYKFIEISSIYT